jgi:ISXO2-like transposase domain
MPSSRPYGRADSVDPSGVAEVGITSWFAAIYHLTQSKNGISAIELGRRLGVKRQTAWLMKHKLMRAMAAREAEKPRLEGRVEIDDAYLGGERSGGKRGPHAIDDRMGCPKRGRGAAGKQPFVAAVETTPARKPKRLRLSVVKGFRKKEIERLAKRDFASGSEIVSDGLSCWPAVEKAGCSHRPMATGSGRQAARWTPFRWVNTVLGNIKTALAGTYHHVSAKHAQSYLTSFAYRFNRRFQLDSIVERLAWAAIHTSPQPYRVITADA